MSSKLTTYPASDLAGVHRLTLPFALDADGYTEPSIESFIQAGYLGADAAAVQDVAGLFTLPEIPGVSTQISRGDVAELPYDNVTKNIATSWTFPRPANRTNGQLLTLITVSQETIANDRGVPQVVSGPALTYEWSHVAAADHSPRISLFWRIIDGTESADWVLDFSGLQSRLFGAAILWNGVNNLNPFDVAEVSTTAETSHANPDPPSLVTRTPGAAVVAVMAGDKTGGAPADPPVTYTEAVDQSAQDRFLVVAHKTIENDGYENPGAFSCDASNSTAVTMVLRPAGSRATIMVAAGTADNSATTELAAGDAPEIGARNEVQEISSTQTSGTFTLGYGGQVTAAIDFDATAAEIQTALEALSTINVGEISVTGSSIDVAPVEVEFIGALAETNVTLIAADGSVTVTELVIGSAAEQFTLRGDLNIPRAGGSYTPQMHIWTLATDDYLPGKIVDAKISSQASGIKSWVAVLAVLVNADDTNPLVVSGADETGNAHQAGFGAMTPGVAGAKAIAVVLRALPNAADYYASGADAVSSPTGYSSVASGESDSMAVDIFQSPSVPADPVDPGIVSWPTTHRYATKLLELRPETGLTTLAALADAVNEPGAESWIEIAQAAGNMYEVLEVDLAGIPSDAVITGASIEVDHETSVRNSLRIALAGIKADDSFVVAAESAAGYVPEPLGERQTSATTVQSTFGDGSTIDQYDRLGVVLRSTAAAPGLSSHKIHQVRMIVEYEPGGPVVSNVVGPDNAGETITWEYSSTGAFEQIGYEAMVIAGSSQDPATATAATDPLDPATGEIVYSSGVVYDPDARSLLISDAPLARGAMTVGVRALAQLPSGLMVYSDWTTDNFNISGSGPSAPSGVSAAFNSDRGTVEISATAPSGITRGWLMRSADGGTTWEITESSPFEASPGAVVISDDRHPFQKTLDYQLTFDAGPMSETAAPVSAGQVSTVQGRAWYLMTLGDPERNLKVDVVTSGRRKLRNSVQSLQPKASLIGSSPDLGTVHQLTIRYRTEAERLALDALLETGETLRLVDVIGRSWFVTQFEDAEEDFYKAMALPSESTALRDMGEYAVTLIEVTPR